MTCVVVLLVLDDHNVKNRWSEKIAKVRCTKCGCILVNPANKEKMLCADHGGTKSMIESLPRGFKRV